MQNKRPKGCVVCYRSQIFEEIYARLSLKVPILVIFLKIVSPFGFPHPNFFQVPPFYQIFKILVPLFEKRFHTVHIALSKWLEMQQICL